MTHHYDVAVAKLYGIAEAVIVDNLVFWQIKNEANKKGKIDGRYWTYNTVSAWAKLFPEMEEHQISRCLKKLEDKGAIVSAFHSENKFDRKKYYSVESHILYDIYGHGEKHIIEAERVVEETPLVATNESKYETRESKIDAIYSFDLFWNEYGHKKGVAKARKKYYSLSCSHIQIIKDTIKEYVSATTTEATRGQDFVPFRQNALTYLGGTYLDYEKKEEESSDKNRTNYPLSLIKMSYVRNLISNNIISETNEDVLSYFRVGELTELKNIHINLWNQYGNSIIFYQEVSELIYPELYVK